MKGYGPSTRTMALILSSSVCLIKRISHFQASLNDPMLWTCSVPVVDRHRVYGEQTSTIQEDQFRRWSPIAGPSPSLSALAQIIY